jgi:signal transduction histidine kinase
VQAPYIETATGDFTFVISLPVVKDERVWGVLAGRVDMDVLQGIMTERTGLGETGETYLVSRESNYLLTPSRFEGFTQNRAYHTEGIDAALAGNDGSGIYQNYQEVDVFGVYRWLPELQSGFIAEMNEEEGVATMIQVRNLSVLASAVAAGVAALIGVGISLYITRPIEALTKIATQIAAGDHSQRAHIHQKNEIGQLADAFNTMTYQLVQSITQLDLNVKELDEANRDLKAATAKAEEASRLKDEFLAVMSHELRTPLNAIIGYLGILLMTGGLDERSGHMVKRVRANAERLLALINDILEISRIEAGRLQLHPQEIELSAFVERLRENMGMLAEQKGLEFHVQFAYDLPPTCYADEDALTKVASNLLSNAIKFTQEGSVTLDVSRQECDLIIKVEDTGVGIPPHLHEVVFERFRQADSSSTRAQGGSGLGLSIVHHLCVAMNGRVTLESAPGEGSTFTVTLPILQDEMLQLVRE